MGRLFRKLLEAVGIDNESDGETHDVDVDTLKSDITKAVYEELRNHHVNNHHKTWNITKGSVVGEMDQTPKGEWENAEDPPEGHSDWFPQKMGEIIARTRVWCDVMSLGPPDGMFMEEFQKALLAVHENADPERPPVIRMLFGNIIGMPVNCNKVIEELTALLPEESNILVWVGAWRHAVSWNHAKIIAVDGQYLHTGGHNLWDYHYCRSSPVHDLSFELSGSVTHDAHLYANEQWKYIIKRQKNIIGRIVNKIPDKLPTVLRVRVTVSEYPSDEAGEFPPLYKMRRMPESEDPGETTMIPVGRYGKIHSKDKAADTAFRCMLNNAKTIIRLGIQDLGPVCIPGTKVALPGCTWPHDYLAILGSAIYERGVDVEIVVSNPGSIPGGLSGTEACYGNGWSCVDVCAEIIKSIQKKYEESDERLREMIEQNLRVCVLRKAGANTYADTGMTIGMHAKHFIVDDEVCYVGSQNFYVCDLAEWGVIIDDPDVTAALKSEYWDPMWEQSYLDGIDVDVDAVMDGLDVDRDGDPDASEEDVVFAATHLTAHASAAADHYDDNDSGSDYEE